jgi:hypothetical protein
MPCGSAGIYIPLETFNRSILKMNIVAGPRMRMA